MNRMKVLTYLKEKDLNAGPKAPRDIINILKNRCDAKSLKVVQPTKSNKYLDYKVKVKRYLLALKSKNDKELTIIQHPFSNNLKIAGMLSNSAILIHDLDSLRYGNKNNNEIEALKNYKIIISHNKKMTEYLEEQGVKGKIYELELFDYLCEQTDIKKTREIMDKVEIIYAGNLMQKKSPFIYQLEDNKINYTLNLYGIGIKQDISENIKYKGAFSPEELPNKMEGNIGLVWDGNFDESDENEGFKNYTKYNNPHKLSCYIAAGIPVIVWEKAAIADFVKKYEIGYTIHNLYEINDLDFCDYEFKLKNVKNLSNKVRNGYFTKRVIDKIMEDRKNV